MALVKFNLPDVLTRERSGLDLVACDVLIAKGTPDSFDFADKAAFDAFVAEFESVGINAEGSPTWSNADITKKYDYETNTKGVNCTGNTILIGVDQALIDWCDDELRNEIVTLLYVPKDYASGDKVYCVYGVKLTATDEGTGNSDDTDSMLTLAYDVRRKKRSEVTKTIIVPA